MKCILKNNLLRLMQIKRNVFLFIILTICSMFVAIAMSNQSQILGRIAVLKKDQAIVQTNAQVNVHYVKQAIPKSQLVMQKYDAYVYRDTSGNIKIDTIKGSEFKQELNAILAHTVPIQPKEETRGKGTRIVSFSMMFLMLQSAIYMTLFGEDKEKHVVNRIMVSTMTPTRYLLSQIVFVILCSFLPAFITIAIVSFCGVCIGFSLWSYALLFLLLTLLSTMLTLCMNCIIHSQDDANMASMSLIVLTTILSGSFITTSSSSTIVNTLSALLPQKGYIAVAQAMENGTFSQTNFEQLLYIFVIIVALFVVSMYSMKKKSYRD